MKRALFLLLIFDIGFAASNLIVEDVDYSNLYSDSYSRIAFKVTNNGDETATVLNATLPFSSYYISFIPDTISPSESVDIVFMVFDSCEPRGNSYPLFMNLSYQDSSGLKQLDSSVYTIVVESPLNISILFPDSIDNSIGIPIDSKYRLTYLVENLGYYNKNISIILSHPNSIYSVIYTSFDRYVGQSISNTTFLERPKESILFSHLLMPIVSGESGTYSITVKDNDCSYNNQIINLRYSIVSSVNRGGFNIIFADEPLVFAFLSLFILRYLFNYKSTHKK